MKSFFTYFLAFTVFLSASFGLLLVQPVSAASIYDGDLQTRTTLNLTNSNGDNLDVTYDYESIINDVCGENVFDALQFAKLNGSYSVAQNYGTTSFSSDGRINTVELGFKLSTVASLSWNYGYITADNVYRIVIAIKNGGDLDCYYSGTDVGIGAAISTNPANGWSSNTALFYTNFNANYPPDYAGIPIPSQPPVSVEGEIPQIGYTIFQDKRFFGISTNQSVTFPTNLGGNLAPYLSWVLYAPDGETVMDEMSGTLATPYEYQFTGVDTYYLEVSYIQPPPPAALFSEDVTLGKVRFTLNVNGNFIRGGNVDPETNECETSGAEMICGEANPLEDCSTYGLDIGGYFQCIVTNFGIWLRTTLTDLFVPKYSFMNGWVTSFGDFLNTKLGAVYTSFGIVGNLFTGMIGAGATGKCSVAPPGQIFGASFELNVCKFEQVAGNVVFTALRALVIGLTILALVFALYRKYLEVVDHR